jgi:hypothetical protein
MWHYVKKTRCSSFDTKFLTEFHSGRAAEKISQVNKEKVKSKPLALSARASECIEGWRIKGLSLIICYIVAILQASPIFCMKKNAQTLNNSQAVEVSKKFPENSDRSPVKLEDLLASYQPKNNPSFWKDLASLLWPGICYDALWLEETTSKKKLWKKSSVFSLQANL